MNPLNAWKDDRGRWYVEVERLRCPQCRTPAPKPQRGKTPNGDGTFTRPHICEACAARISVIIS